MFETFKSMLLEVSPGPGFTFLSEQVEGGYNVGKIWDEFPVKVCKPGERLDSLDGGGGFPLFYGFQLLPVHLDFPLSDDHAQKFHTRGIKYAFQEFDRQSMFSKLLKYMSSSFMMEGYVVFSVDAKVVHVDFQPFLFQHVSKDVIHECLKCGGGIAEPEEHDSGFKKSHGGNESGFPLILLPDANVVISPMNVELGK